MKRPSILLILLSVFLLGSEALAQRPRPTADLPKWEGVCATPQMGWSSWNKFMTDINEDIIKENADALVSLGLADVGYVYVNVDDHTDFITKSFSDKYFTPWRTFLQANTDALGGEFTTFFMQLPFKEELIHSNHLTVPSTTKRY